nr:hypothetical protein [Mesorhizobium tianshanense]
MSTPRMIVKGAVEEGHLPSLGDAVGPPILREPPDLVEKDGALVLGKGESFFKSQRSE